MPKIHKTYEYTKVLPSEFISTYFNYILQYLPYQKDINLLGPRASKQCLSLKALRKLEYVEYLYRRKSVDYQKFPQFDSSS